MSLVIPMRMCLLPLPCIVNHRGKVGFLWNPAQFIANLAARSDEYGRVSSTPGSLDGVDRNARYFTGGLDHLTYRKSQAIAKIIDAVFSGKDAVQCEQVSARQVLDVNIVADRGSIRCGIVGSVDLNRRTLSCRH